MKPHNSFIKVLKYLRKFPSSAGYTLTELLIGASLTSVVVGAAGFGLIQVMNLNKSGNAQVERRMEVNRALDFISDEVRRAESIETDTSDTNLTSVASGFSRPSDAKVVLALNIPGLDQRVIYYVRPKPSGSNWAGPSVIYRWGPPINSDGQYTTATWQYEPLVDRIDDSVIEASCPGLDNILGTSSDPDTNSNGVPDTKEDNGIIQPSDNPGTSNDDFSDELTGFYACVQPDGKIAQIVAYAQEVNSGQPYKAEAQVYARAEENIWVASLPNASSTKTRVKIKDGNLTVNQPSRLTFEVIGHDYNCTNVGNTPYMWDVKTKLNIGSEEAIIQRGSPALELTANAGDEVIATAMPEKRGDMACSNSGEEVVSTETAKVKALRKGEPVPSFGNGYGSQDSIEEYLEDYTKTQTRNDGSTEKVINIKDNQIIYLFEIGQSDNTKSGFDMQDNIVLVTVNPQ